MPSRRFRALAACAAPLLLARVLQADDELEYRHAVYAEENGRMTIVTDSALLQQDLGTDTRIQFTGTEDAVAGASPTGVPFDVAQEVHANWIQTLHNRRKAWGADLIQQAGRVSLDAAFDYSREDDYTSYGGSFNTVTDFNAKNTSLLAGVAVNDDSVQAPLLGGIWTRRHKGSADLGLTQVIDPQTSVTVTLTWTRMTGFLDDQYKEVEKAIALFPGIPPLVEFFPENRPNLRDKGTVFAELNHAVTAWHGALDASYRYYRDTFGIGANTFEVAWLQHIGRRLILTPSARLYEQSAASFYYYHLDGTSIVPVVRPTGTGEFYSSDYRLSGLQTRDYGLKGVFQATSWLELDLAYDNYKMWGADRITPEFYYPHAHITTAGVKVTW